MKKHIRIIALFTIAIALLLSLISCEDNAEYKAMDKTYFGEYMSNDEIPLDKALKKKYDLNELKEYFGGQNNKWNVIGSENNPYLYIDDVNQRFPIEIIRTNGYSVYKVKQGGYYYVFWAKEYDFPEGYPTCNEDFYNLDYITNVYVGFAAYLSSPISRDDFKCIKEGTSTTQDVYNLDESVEMEGVRNCGPFSYSILNDEKVMEIEYEHPNGSHGKNEDFIVETKHIIPREEAVTSYYRCILNGDFPDSFYTE